MAKEEKTTGEAGVRTPKDEPIVLGMLKKEKSSKPAVVVTVFLLIAGALLALPYAEAYLKEADNIAGDLYRSVFGDHRPLPEDPGTSDTIHFLDKDTKIIFDRNIRITNVSLDNNVITFYIRHTHESVDLSAQPYYLEIYGSGENMLQKIRLEGVTESDPVFITHTFTEFRFNSAVQYRGRIQIHEEGTNTP